MILKFKSYVPYSFLIFSAIGLMDSTFLTMEHLKGEIAPCSLSKCELVLTSQYSEFFGIPTAFFGVLYYLAIFVLALAVFLLDDSKNEKKLKSLMNKYSKLKAVEPKDFVLTLISIFSFAGMITSLLLIYVQYSIINAFCQYCMLSAFTSTMIFVSGLYYLSTRKKN